MQLSIGERLKEERERPGLSQLAFGELSGVKKLAQLNYEKGDRYPDAQYLAALAWFGVDVQYVVTGDRSVSSMPQDEARLIELYRAAPVVVKMVRHKSEPSRLFREMFWGTLLKIM